MAHQFLNGLYILTAAFWNTYNPTTFILKTADGTSYTIEQKLGLTALTDAHGNTHTVTSSGSTSSADKSVPFARDAQGRNISITDLNGNKLYYAYNSSSDLGTVTDDDGNATGNLYDNNHKVTSIMGRVPANLPRDSQAFTVRNRESRRREER